MDVKKILLKMTIEEKISILQGADRGYTIAVPRLGIPRILLCDGPHGLRVCEETDPNNAEKYTMVGNMKPATAFPCEALMAATWNLELIREMGFFLAEECKEYGVSVLLGPGVNQKRSPLGGRNFEYYSEDPYLSGKMAASFISGLQGNNIAACLKHFVLNDQETKRTTINVHIDDRTLREIYIRPFEIAIKESKPWSVMASYNKVNGVQMAHNEDLLSKTLKEELKFDGCVISDWGAVTDKIASIINGLDLQMPYETDDIMLVRQAIDNGIISESVIDERVYNILSLVNKVLSNTNEYASGKVNWNQHHAMAIKLAEEGIVLLKNEDNILPLKKKAKIAVFGELAKYPYNIGNGSSTLTPHKTDSILESIAENFDIIYEQGYIKDATNETYLKRAKEIATSVDTILIFTGKIASEGSDTTDMRLADAQYQLIDAVLTENSNVIVINQSASAVEIRQFDKKIKGLLQCWFAGEGFGKALVNILSGKTNPSGRLSETFPKRIENTPAFQFFPGNGNDVWYHEGLMVGYRYYDTQEIEPLYPFGFGLSYTKFLFENIKVDKKNMYNEDELSITLDISNIGELSGAEVVQVYLADCESTFFRPKKELKAFQKVFLQRGEKRTISFTLESDSFAYYVSWMKRFAIESGIFKVIVATSASDNDIQLEETITYISSDEVRPPRTEEDLFRDFLSDDRYRKRAQKKLDFILERLNKNADGANFSGIMDMILGSSLKGLVGLLEFMQFKREETIEMIKYILG